MAQKYSAFTYQPGNSFLHRLPAWIKILIIPALNILFFCLPPVFSVILICTQVGLGFYLHFGFRSQLQDLKPVIYYAFLLYIFSFFGNVFASGMEGIKITFQNKETAIMLVKLFCIMQSCSLMFRTSTSLEIRDGIGVMETAVRKVFHLKPQNQLTNLLSLFICFIPMVYKTWNQSVRAWKARHGKTGIRMYLTLLPVLFSVGMKQAYNTSKAVAIRSKDR